MGKERVIHKKRRSYEYEESPHRLERRMTRDYADVLQNIEAVMVAVWGENPEVDDRAVAEALRAEMGQRLAEGEAARRLSEALQEIRAVREEIEEPVWRAGLKVVLDSAGRHSSLRPGDRGYLQFAANFVR